MLSSNDFPFNLEESITTINTVTIKLISIKPTKTMDPNTKAKKELNALLFPRSPFEVENQYVVAIRRLTPRDSAT